MSWTAPDVTLPDFDLTTDERTLLEDFLDWHRALFLHKAAGLTGEQLATASVPPSNLTLLGLIRHMAKVERKWFRERIGKQEMPTMYDESQGRDADFEQLDASAAQQDYERYVEEVRLAKEALADASYDDVIDGGQNGPMSVRAVVLHMVEEYAQHNGHADLIRERVDGATDKD